MKNAGKTTTMLKAKFSNKVNRIINPNPTKGKSAYQVRREIEKMTDAQKLEMFNKIVQAHVETSNELTSYLYERREKKRTIKRREASIAAGTRKKKNRMTKQQWLEMSQTGPKQNNSIEIMEHQQKQAA